MSEKYTSETDLVRDIGKLPRSMTPQRDLWPGIEQKLSAKSGDSAGDQRRVGWRSSALAAAITVAFATGILLGRQIGTETPGPSEDSLSANRALLAATHATEREYQAAFRQFIPFSAAPSMIGQQAVQNIEGSWFELQQAETALLAALDEHPENSYLNQRLLDLRSRQLDFMKQLATLDQFSRRKT